MTTTNLSYTFPILETSATASCGSTGIGRFEADVAEYEARGRPKPSDEILRAVLLQLVSENLEEHLELNIQRFDTYRKTRAEVISFLEQKVSKSLVDDGGAAPMELDYVGGKGKGKKGKDKGGSAKTCYCCDKAGHLAKDCWQNPKGKGKNSQGSSSNKGKGITKEKEKALRLKEKERARNLARITPWRASNWQKEKNGPSTGIKRIGLPMNLLTKSQVSRAPSVWEEGSVLYQHGPRLPPGQRRSCNAILKQASFGRDFRTSGVCLGS